MKKIAFLLALTILTIGCGGCVNNVQNIKKAVKPDGFENKNTTGISKGLQKLNFIDDDSASVNLKKVKQDDSQKGKPFAIDPKYDDEMGISVAICDVKKHFNAKGDGKTDDTKAIQNAIDFAKSIGGGTVYIPEGEYLCEGTLNIPSAVTLRGEWQSPEKAQPACNGTILLTTANKGSDSDKAFVNLNPTAGIRNLNIVYPKQSPTNPEKYPPTIYQTGGDSATAYNITIIGAWIGIKTNPDGNELHYFKNMYISAASEAFYLDTTTDIGRLENIHISPEFWAKNKAAPVSEKDIAVLNDYFYKNAIGVHVLRSDWQYAYDVTIEGLNKGLYITYGSKGAPNAQFMKFDIKNCETGVDIEMSNDAGLSLTDFNITTTKPAKYAISLSKTFRMISQFDNINIDGAFKSQVNFEGNGTATFLNSTFSNWNSSTDYAVNHVAGGLTFQQCNFKGDAKHFNENNSALALVVLGCDFSAKQDIKQGDQPPKITINDEKLNIPQTSGRQHVYRKTVPTSKSNKIFDITDYGATSKKDSTKAINDALADAKKSGGIVYIPAGLYVVSEPIIVPSGVELRGVFDVPSHSMGGGSILSTSVGKADEKSQPFISLQEGSGVRGFSVYYPLQNHSDFEEYSWTVQSQGKNCWAIDVVLLNAYNGFDFGTNPSDGHYINYVSGTPLRRGVFVGNNSSNGWLENVQFNPHYWVRGTLPNPGDAGWQALMAGVNSGLDAIILGDNKSEHVLGTFVFAAKNAFVLKSQGGKGTNGTIIGHGSDGCEVAIRAEQFDVVEMINTELVAMASQKYKAHLIVEKESKGTLALFNTLSWAEPTDSVLIKGGNVIMTQNNFAGAGNRCVAIEGGNFDMFSCYIKSGKTHLDMKDATVNMIGNILRSGNRIGFVEEENFIINKKSGTLNQKFSVNA